MWHFHLQQREIGDVYAIRCGHFFNLSIFFSRRDQGQGYTSLFLITSETIPFLCFVWCNLGDIFNVLQCFVICMLACSNGLQHCSSMAHQHQKTSFLYSGIQRLFSFLKCNRTVTDAPVLYVASLMVYSSRV